MITVSILINDRPVYTRSAVNKGPREMSKQCIYKLDTGKTIFHNPADGAISLAIAMLETIHEVK